MKIRPVFKEELWIAEWYPILMQNYESLNCSFPEMPLPNPKYRKQIHGAQLQCLLSNLYMFNQNSLCS